MTKDEAKAVAAEFTRVAKKKGFTFETHFFHIEGRRGAVWTTRSNGYNHVPGCTIKMDGVYGSGSSLLPAKSFNIKSIEDVPRVVELVIERAKLLAATNADFQEKVRVAREQEQREKAGAEELVRGFARVGIHATCLRDGNISLSPSEAKAVIETMKRAGKIDPHICHHVNGGPCKICGVRP